MILSHKMDDDFKWLIKSDIF